MSAPDVIVVGGGHNGLVAAILAAQAGKSVTLLERNRHPGGATVGQQLFPPHPASTASASLTRHDRLAAGAVGWTSAAPLATARNAAGAAVIGGRLYVVGGRSPGIRAGDQTSLASTEVYDPAADTWSAGVPLPTARGSLAVAALGGRLYAMGGESTPGTVSDAVERFDPATGAWSTLTAMPLRAHGLAVVAAGDALYVMGGFTGASDAVGTESAALYRYTPPT